MKILINENHLKNLQKDLNELYPKTWDLNTFKNLKSFNTRIQYCNQHLQRLSSGSSRIVYKIDDEKVLKLAKNKKGFTQNKQETLWGSDGFFGEILAKVFDHDENYSWIEMELAQKLTNKKFTQIVGYPIYDVEMYITKMYNKYKNKPIHRLIDIDPIMEENLNENEFIQLLIQYIMETNIIIGDIGRLSSYGVVNRNGSETIVLIDYGLTEKDYSNLYKR